MRTAIQKQERFRHAARLIWSPPGDAFDEARLEREFGSVRPWFVDLKIPGYHIFASEPFIDETNYFLQLQAQPVTATKLRVCLPSCFYIYGLRYFGHVGYEMQVHAPVAQFVAPVNVRQFLLDQDETRAPVMVQLAHPVSYVEVFPLPTQVELDDVVHNAGKTQPLWFILALYFRKIHPDASRCKKR